MDRLDVIVDNKTFVKQKLSLLKNLERKTILEKLNLKEYVAARTNFTACLGVQLCAMHPIASLVDTPPKEDIELCEAED